MLQHLSIRNIVLIDACELGFAPGLNVLTGETGAGKSILLDALGLVLGGRADARAVRTGEASASVTAEFDVGQNKKLRDLFESLGLEWSDALILRRTLGRDGKSRAFANDAAISVATLKSIGEQLVELHGQHDQRGLTDASLHLSILDAFGGYADLRRNVEASYTAWKECSTRRVQHEKAQAAAAREEGYLRHVAAELAALAPKPGEEERLAAERVRLSHGRKLGQILADALREISHPREVDASLHAAARLLSKAPAEISALLSPVIESLERTASEAEEALAQLERLGRESLHDPAGLERIEDRLFALRDAARKHRVTADALPQLLEKTTQALAAIEHGGKDAAALAAAEAAAKAAYEKASSALSKARAKAAKRLETAVAAELGPLRMAGTRLRVAFATPEEAGWGPRGIDAVHFEAATNKGLGLAPIARMASGGELSRFMLAIKVVLSGAASDVEEGGPSLIFDEIDSGTGGAVADAIGQRLARLAEGRQVLVVTHLPQVAARGAHHIRLWKEESRNMTHTRAALLDDAARREELARMLAGAEITPEARRAASRLLEAAG